MAKQQSEHEVKMVMKRPDRSRALVAKFGEPIRIEVQEQYYLKSFAIVGRCAFVDGKNYGLLPEAFPNEKAIDQKSAYRIRRLAIDGGAATWLLTIKAPKDESDKSLEWEAAISEKLAQSLLELTTHGVRKTRRVEEGADGLVYHVDIFNLEHEDGPMVIVEVQNPPANFQPPKGWTIVSDREWNVYNIALNQRFPY